jgi:HlyD family secretion protein
VGTQVSGTIEALHADFNSRVRAGQVVAELEDSLFLAQVQQASATLVRLEAEHERAQVQVDDAQLKLTRARALSSRELLPVSDLETAESNTRQAEAALKSAAAQITQARASLNQNEVNLSHTIIKAPIDGIVVSRNVDVGQTVAASMQAPTLFVIAQDLAEMQVSAAIDESDIGRIRAGQKVTFKVDAYIDDDFTGTVRQVRLQPVVTQNVVSYTTIIAVPNPTLKLRPGMTATVTVEIERADDVLRLPSAALRFRPMPALFASLGQEPSGGMPGLDGPSRHGRAQAPDVRPGSGAGPRAPQTTPRGRSAAAPPADVPAGLRGGISGADGQRPGRGGAGFGDPQRSATDEISGPLEPQRVTRRPVWLLRNGRLERVQLRLSINDGVAMAVVDGPVMEGDMVVTGVSQPAAKARGGGNPLMPFGGRRGGRGRGGRGGS